MALRVFGLAVWLATASTLFGAEIGRRHAPRIFVGGVVNGASFTPAPNNFAAPNAIISIFGVDLALRTKPVGQGDLEQGRLPFSLGGVQVLIGGVPARLYFVSPTQINAQVPTRILPGRWKVKINRESLASNEEEIKVRTVAPGLFGWPSSFVNPPPRAVVTHQDFTLVGRGDPEGSTPARPGELIVLWATGFGPTAPTVFDGELPNFPAWLLLPVKVHLGGEEVPQTKIFYAGQAPGLAGLYQLNFLLEQDVPTGDVEVAVEVDGVSTQLGMTIPIDPASEDKSTLE